VKIAERRFVAHQLGFLFGARWMPEANPVAAGLAGADRIALARTIRERTHQRPKRLQRALA